MVTNKERWQVNYDLLLKYVLENGQLPDKNKIEARSLLNWWKYNRKRLKQGKLTNEQILLLDKLSSLRVVKKTSFIQ